MTVIPHDPVDKVEEVFDRWIIPGITRFSLGEGFPLGFILLACAIDYLAGFNFGKMTRRKDYIDFLKEYKWFTEKYNPKDIYESLRCGLVHNFTIRRGIYVLVCNQTEKHLRTERILRKERVFLNFEDFFEDFKRLKKEFFIKIRKPKENKTRVFLKRLRKVGFLLLLDVKTEGQH